MCCWTDYWVACRPDPARQTPNEPPCGRSAAALWGVVSASLRLERGLTQEALALESGVTRNVLIHVEHGKRGLLFERLYDIAEVLGVPASDLLDDSMDA